MENYLTTLRECRLFDDIEDQNLTVMLGCLGAKVISFDKKYTIFAEGNPAKYIGILLSGKAQIIRVDYYGNRSIIGEVMPNEIFGEDFACAEVDHIPVTFIADEPSEVMLIDRSHILHTCKNNCAFHQQLIFNLMKALASKTLSFHQKIEVTSKRSTREKLMAYLMLRAQKAGTSRFEIPFDRQELADYLEVDRSGLSAEISRMKKEGIIDNVKNVFEIL